jgi:phosphopantothenoylcysteine decarboxylase/phosphopantothenate--cysteine ligase
MQRLIDGILLNKNILVGITGSVAIYKIADLIRLYIKSGANVRVVMTNGAKKFINPILFEALTGNKVLDDTNEDWSSDFNHIKIGKWADLFVIAPATANTLNKLNNGIADNILTQVALAYSDIKLLVPAANTNMLHNPITEASFKMLKLCNYQFVDTITKELACKDVGDGALADIEDIFFASARIILKDSYWENRKVVLSGGGTIEKIDDVRYLSNFSSGKMASSLALALYLKGAEVCLVSTRGYEELPKGIHIIEVQSSAEMYEYLQDCLRVARKGVVTKTTLMKGEDSKVVTKKPYLFMVAAVSDFIPKFPQDGKIKKEMIGDNWSLELAKNIDILSSIAKGGIYTIGFKAELDEAQAKKHALSMIADKEVDGVCLNVINPTNPFGGDTNKIDFISSKLESDVYKIAGTKLSTSLRLLTILKEEFSE